jgi:hypothetical protein
MRLLIFILLATFNSVFGQDLKADLIRFNKYLTELDEFKLNVTYSAGDSIELKEENEVSIFVSNEGLFYDIEETKIIINEKNTFLINDKDGTIIYSDNIDTKKIKKKDIDYQKVLLSGIDSLIQNSDSLYSYKDGTKTIYYLRNKKGYYNLVEIHFNNNIIDQLIYYYNSTYSIEEGLKAINKLDLEVDPTFDKKLLKTENYIISENNNIKPTEEFKNYILIYNESSENIFE